MTSRRRWVWGLRLWGLRLGILAGCALALSACPALAQTPAAASRQAEVEAAAISAVVQAYYAALNQRDVEAALRLWSDRSPEIADVSRLLPQVLERTKPEWSDVDTTLMSVSGDTARARVRYVVRYSYTTQSPSSPLPTRSVMTFVRAAGEWRIHGEKPEAQDVAERLMAAADDAALDTIVREEGEAITLTTVRFLIGLAGHAFASRQHDAATRGFERAVRFSETPVGPLTEMELKNDMAAMSLGQALGGLALVYIYKAKPDLPRGVELLTRALALHERVKNDGGMSDALQALGNAYYTLGDYAQALDAYQRVLPIAEKMQDRDAMARTNQGIGNTQYLFGQYDRALAAYTIALDTFVALGKLGTNTVDDQARALQGLGRVFAAVGDFDRGRIEFGGALALLEATPAPASQKAQQASVLLELGRMDFQQGVFDGANTLYTRALTVAEAANDPFTQGRALYSLGLVSVVRSAFDEAVQQYTRAADAFQRIPNADAAGQAWLARASARLEQRDLRRALEDFKLTLKTFQGTKNEEGLARAHLGLGMTYVQQRNQPESMASAGWASEYAARSQTADVAWQAVHVMALSWRLAGDRERTRTGFEEAIGALESLRLDSSGSEEALAPTERAAPYVGLVEWHVEHGNASDALIAADAQKRRLLEDLLRPFRFRLTRGLSVARMADERRLVNRRVSLLKQIRRERELILTGDPASEIMPKLRARAAALEKALASVRTEAGEWQQAVARDLPSLVYFRGEASFASLDPLAAALPPTAAFIHFVVGDDRTSVIVATHPRASSDTAGARTDGGDDGTNRQAAPRLDVHAFTVALTRQQLAEQVWRYTDGIAKKADTVMADGRALYDLLLAPAADRIAGRTTLVIVPDDALWTLPFEALMPADGRYLIEDAAITLLPSASAWLSRPDPVGEQPLSAIAATGAVSDIVPFQTRLTFPPADLPPLRPGVEPVAAPASTTLAAWELFERDLTTHDLVLADVTPKEERLRLDVGRLGPTGLYWALQVAGARRVIFSRRPAIVAETAPASGAVPAGPGLPHPQEWATWLVIGPPEPPSQPQARP